MVAGSNPVAPTIFASGAIVAAAGMISFLSYRLGATLARALPEDLSRSIADAIAFTQYHSRFGTRRNVRSNLRLVMGESASEEEVNAAARAVFFNFARAISCFLHIDRYRCEEGRARCDFQGLDAVLAALRRRGGFLLVGPHVGPWEIGGAFLSKLDLRIHTVALDHPSARVTDFFDERRRSVGIVCHSLGGAFEELRAALEGGDCVALLIDRKRNEGKAYPMFGRNVTLPTGHAALAVQCGAPILTGVCVFAPPGDRFKFVFNGPHYPDPALDEDSRIEDLHRRCRADMERYIREYPDQWFNFESLEDGARA